ncbi:MAG: hypothetical protein ACOYXT_29055, partial [Bacteroidota bacterium]
MLKLFKRKKETTQQANAKSKTIFCIPGRWKDRSEIVTSIVEKNLGEFIFAGNILLNVKTNQGFAVEIHERDERMRLSFEYSGKVNRLSNEFLDEISNHTDVIYVIAETGNLRDAHAIAEAGLAVLNAGGLGLKVESTGKAFTKEHWTRLLTDFEEANLYEMFVLDSINNGQGTTYSCGMHNLGLKDSIVSDLEVQVAVNLLSVFGYYQIVDKPTIRDKQTFSTRADSPVFQITNEAHQPNQGDELFENPYGMW